jgi:hypothetical protein
MFSKVIDRTLTNCWVVTRCSKAACSDGLLPLRVGSGWTKPLVPDLGVMKIIARYTDDCVMNPLLLASVSFDAEALYNDKHGQGPKIAVQRSALSYGLQYYILASCCTVLFNKF